MLGIIELFELLSIVLTFNFEIRVERRQMILTMHFLFTLVLDEGVAPGFVILGVLHHVDALNLSVLLKFPLQLGLAGVVVDPRYKQSLEWISRHFLGVARIPHGDLLFKLVGNLLGFLLLPSVPPLLPGLHLYRGGGVDGVLEEMDELSDPMVIVSLLLLMRQLVRRWQVRYWISGRK